jgi:hypothetical protein
LNREYLEDYEQREKSEYKRFLERLKNGSTLSDERYPPDNRFVKLQRPLAALYNFDILENIWAQVPFAGSLLIPIPPLSKETFERYHIGKSEIQKIVDFVKETGRLQVSLLNPATAYQGLDFLDPIFELKPPVRHVIPLMIKFCWNDKDCHKELECFNTIGGIRFFSTLTRIKRFAERIFPTTVGENLVRDIAQAYVELKLLNYYDIIEELENLMVDDPEKAYLLFVACITFILCPLKDSCPDLLNYSIGQLRETDILPPLHQPHEMRLPFEIGKFLFSKLTYAPMGLDACKELIYHYDAYDLRKVQASLNDAIVANNLDALQKDAEALSEILTNIWNDKTIPHKVKGLRAGVPLSIAAIGSVAAGPIGAVGGFLAGLGFSIADKFIDLKTEGLSERLAKVKTKSYQANIYDFKQKYENRIVLDSGKLLR